LALHECRACVEKIGLSGLGKKGLLVTAKTLSEEALPENRAAALDLMEAVLSKMDGDVEKLVTICGTTYLSDKAKALIEERLKKHSDIQPSSSLHSLKRDDQARRRSQIPATKTVRRVGAPELFNANPSPNTIKTDRSSTGSAGLRDELPSLKLRLDEGRSTFSTKPTESALSMGPFAFSFEPPQQSFRQFEPVESSVNATTGATYANKLPEASLDALPWNETGPSSSQTDGAAASLRARLLRIREKQREVRVESRAAVSMSSFQPSLSPPDSPLTEPATTLETRPVRDQSGDSGEVSGNPYSILRASLEELLHTKMPVPEADPRLVSCTGALKKYHAAISSQPTAAPDLSYTDFLALRQSISDNTIETVENLTR
jgi:hypothetical protein